MDYGRGILYHLYFIILTGWKIERGREKLNQIFVNASRNECRVVLVLNTLILSLFPLTHAQDIKAELFYRTRSLLCRTNTSRFVQ